MRAGHTVAVGVLTSHKHDELPKIFKEVLRDVGSIFTDELEAFHDCSQSSDHDQYRGEGCNVDQSLLDQLNQCPVWCENSQLSITSQADQ